MALTFLAVISLGKNPALDGIIISFAKDVTTVLTFGLFCDGLFELLHFIVSKCLSH